MEGPFDAVSGDEVDRVAAITLVRRTRGRARRVEVPVSEPRRIVRVAVVPLAACRAGRGPVSVLPALRGRAVQGRRILTSASLWRGRPAVDRRLERHIAAGAV